MPDDLYFGLDPKTGLPREKPELTPDQIAARAAMAQLDQMAGKRRIYGGVEDPNQRTAMDVDRLERATAGGAGEYAHNREVLQVNPGYRSGLTPENEAQMSPEVAQRLKQEALNNQGNQKPMYMRMNGKDYYGVTGARVRGGAPAANALAQQFSKEQEAKIAQAQLDRILASREAVANAPYKHDEVMADKNAAIADKRHARDFTEGASRRAVEEGVLQNQGRLVGAQADAQVRDVQQAPGMEGQRRAALARAAMEELDRRGGLMTNKSARQRRAELDTEARKNDPGYASAGGYQATPQEIDSFITQQAPSLEAAFKTKDTATIDAELQRIYTQTEGMEPEVRQQVLDALQARAAKAYNGLWFNDANTKMRIGRVNQPDVYGQRR